MADVTTPTTGDIYDLAKLQTAFIGWSDGKPHSSRNWRDWFPRDMYEPNAYVTYEPLFECVALAAACIDHVWLISWCELHRGRLAADLATAISSMDWGCLRPQVDADGRLTGKLLNTHFDN